MGKPLSAGSCFGFFSLAAAAGVAASTGKGKSTPSGRQATERITARNDLAVCRENLKKKQIPRAISPLGMTSSCVFAWNAIQGSRKQNLGNRKPKPGARKLWSLIAISCPRRLSAARTTRGKLRAGLLFRLTRGEAKSSSTHRTRVSPPREAGTKARPGCKMLFCLSAKVQYRSSSQYDDSV